MKNASPIKDQAYRQIKHKIITFAFKPGECLNEAQVSAVLGLGRTPVHQAIARLGVEGLIDILPRKGLVVRPIDIAEVFQVIAVRLINEVLCVRLATERATDREIANMEAILERAQAAFDRRDIEKMMLLDREFHLALVAAARNPVLAEILRNLHERSLRLWFISLTAPAQQKRVQVEHQRILAAIRRRDVRAAEAAMRKHIASLQTNVTPRGTAANGR
jgi:DNA-binding GntR family transcriptional regulator